MSELFTYFVMFVEVFALFVVAESRFKKKFERKWIYTGVMIVCFVCSLTMQNLLKFENVVVKTCVVLAVFELMIVFFYEGCLWKKLVTCLIWGRKKRNREYNDYILVKYWLQMLIIPAGMMLNLCLVIFYAINENRLSFWSVVDVIILIAGNVLFLLLEQKLEQERNMEILNKELACQIQSEKEQVDFLIKNYQEQRKITHDFRNHLFTIEGLLKNENYSEAEVYLHKLLQSDIQLERIICTKHPIVDAILNRAYLQAKGKGIIMEFELSNLQNIPLQHEELVVVLSNLLDNAIEASSMGTDEKRIVVRLRYDENEFVISIRNTTSEGIAEWGEVVITTKEEKWLHGYGLQNVKEILKKRGGDYAISCVNGWFQFTAIVR